MFFVLCSCFNVQHEMHLKWNSNNNNNNSTNYNRSPYNLCMPDILVALVPVQHLSIARGRACALGQFDLHLHSAFPFAVFGLRV